MASNISIRDLHVERGAFSLDVERLDVAAGETFAILGKTGSGKTVLLESVAGAFPLQAGRNRGTVEVGGRDIALTPLHARGIGVVYQDHALFPNMTVEQNVAYGLKMHRVPREQAAPRVGAMLELLGISHIAKSHPALISGGEAQRCALARALVLEPGMLLLDEPFSALDPATKELMYATLGDVRARFGVTVLFVTHDFAEAGRLADRVGILLGGRLRCVVRADELLRPGSPHLDMPDVRSFLGM